MEASHYSPDALTGHELLSQMAEVRLAVRAHDGDTAARNELVVHNVRLAAHNARAHHMSDGAMDRDDYLQEAMLGLLRAGEKFDAEKGVRFSTYATWWVRQATSRAAADRGRVIRIPVHMVDKLRPILAFRAKYKELCGLDPSVGEISQHFKLDRQEVNDLLALPFQVESLDSELTASDRGVLDGCGGLCGDG